VYVISAQTELNSCDTPIGSPIAAETLLISLGMVMLSTGGTFVRIEFEPTTGDAVPGHGGYFGDLFGARPSLLAAITGVLASTIFMVPPYLTLAVSDTEYILTFIGLFVVSLV